MVAGNGYTEYDEFTDGINWDEVDARTRELEEIESGKKKILDVLIERDHLKWEVEQLKEMESYYARACRRAEKEAMEAAAENAESRGGLSRQRKIFVSNIGWVLTQMNEDIKDCKLHRKGKKQFATISYWENEKHLKTCEEQKEIDITGLSFAEIFCAIASNFKKPLSRWIEFPHGGIKCPKCGTVYNNDLQAKKFCANCGAEMKGIDT